VGGLWLQRFDANGNRSTGGEGSQVTRVAGEHQRVWDPASSGHDLGYVLTEALTGDHRIEVTLDRRPHTRW